MRRNETLKNEKEEDVYLKKMERKGFYLDNF